MSEIAIRQVQQFATTVVLILIVIASLVSCKTKPSKKISHLVFFLYGIIGLTFYALVFHGDHGHDLSPTRTLIQDTIIASWLWLWVLRDLWRMRNGINEQ